MSNPPELPTRVFNSRGVIGPNRPRVPDPDLSDEEEDNAGSSTDSDGEDSDGIWRRFVASRHFTDARLETPRNQTAL